ncbi:MAG TPA: pitrilysin family protein [Polyangia bacterium]|jgi:zinc protease|nr:pitrilysin family protein [Polyangia bacterium]
MFKSSPPLRLALPLSLLLGAALPALAAPPAGGVAAKAPAGAGTAPEKVTTVEGITEYRLPNGLRVLLFPDSSKPTVTVNVTYFVGSRHEGYGETGMAHLLEHLLFKGTATRNNILGLLETRGAISNGSTSYDRTNYYETLPSIPGNLDFALALEADRMVNSRVAKADLDTEFSVVRNEFEQGENEPLAVLEERMYSAAYLWHNYGKSTIGSRSDIERVPIDNLKAFYQRYYQPDNAMLVVAGKFDPAEALRLITQYFGPIPRPARKLNPTHTVEPVQDGERAVTLRRAGDVAVVGLVYHSVAGSDADEVAAEAVADILTAKPAGRLYKALIETGLATTVDGDAQPLAEPGVIEFFAKVRPEQAGGQGLERVRDKMIETVEGLARGAIGEDEVKRFQVRRLKEIELDLTQSERIGIELSEWGGMGDWRLLFLHRDNVKKLTLAQVRRFAERYLKANNRTVGLFVPTKAPERSPQPAQPDVAALVKDYKGQEDLQQGEEFAATIDNIEKRTVRTTLPSGMKVALLAKATRGHAVRVALDIHYGSEADLKGRTTAALLIPRMLLRGTKKHTYQQLKDELDRLKAEVRVAGEGGFDGEPGQAQLSISTVRENLPAVLTLLGEVLSQPAFPAEQFEIVRKELLTSFEEELQDPQAQAFQTLLRKIDPHPVDDVRYLPTTRELIERVRALKLADVAGVYRELWGGSASALAIVGDFDAQQVRTTLVAELGGWRSPRPFQRIAEPFQAGIAGSEERIVTPDKQMAMIAAAQAVELGENDPDYPAVEIINFVLGGTFKSRLIDRLRQKEGFSYGASSNVSASPFERHGVIFSVAICAPENADKAMVAMLDELGKLVKDGIPQAELDEAKKSYRLFFDNLLARDGFVAQQLSRGLYTGRTFEYFRQQQERIDALRSADLVPVLQKYFGLDRLVRVKAGDLKG